MLEPIRMDRTSQLGAAGTFHLAANIESLLWAGSKGTLSSHFPDAPGWQQLAFRLRVQVLLISSVVVPLTSMTCLSSPSKLPNDPTTAINAHNPFTLFAASPAHF